MLGLALVMAIVVAGGGTGRPRSQEMPCAPAGWWAFVTVVVLFGLFEYVVFNVEFRKEAISFSLSEIPTALALVFLSPPGALLARLPISLVVLMVVRRNPPYKLAFNISLFAVELLLVDRVVPGARRLVGRLGRRRHRRGHADPAGHRAACRR